MKKVIRTKDLCEILSVSRSTVWRMEKNGQLPLKRKLSSRNVGWFEDELANWIKDLPVAATSKSD